MKRNPADFRLLRKNLKGIIRKPHNILQHIKLNSYLMNHRLTHYTSLYFTSWLQGLLIWLFVGKCRVESIKSNSYDNKKNNNNTNLWQNNFRSITWLYIVYQSLLIMFKVWWKDVYHILKTKGASKLGRSSIYEFERLTW